MLDVFEVVNVPSLLSVIVGCWLGLFGVTANQVPTMSFFEGLFLGGCWLQPDKVMSSAEVRNVIL